MSGRSRKVRVLAGKIDSILHLQTLPIPMLLLKMYDNFLPKPTVKAVASEKRKKFLTV
jgi:hypothetical protein